MSAELGVRLGRAVRVRDLRDRVERLTGSEVRVLALTPDVIRNGVLPDLAPAAVLDDEQPRGWLRLAGGDGVADLLWTGDVDGSAAGDGVADLLGTDDGGREKSGSAAGGWLTVSATWRNEASILLGTYAAIAAAQLGRSVVSDADGLLGRREPVDPDALLAALRRAAPVALAAGPPGSERYAATLRATVATVRPRER